MDFELNMFRWFTLACLLLLQPSYLYAQENVWDVMRAQFSLNHDITQPEVQNQLRWLVTHPNYLNKLAQSEPYIYHILTEIRARHLPGEIALIPMIESAYNPFAYSGVGAAGLWQLMPATGSDLGLKQDWWADNRRSIRGSTKAALDYLTHLHQAFNGDWILAIAAYDAGEGSLTRIIKNSHQYGQRNIHFWSLPVPDETKAYIPRLLALAEIIQNPTRYQVLLPNIAHAPYFEEVNIGSQIDLNRAAKLAGISYQELIKLNPGFNRWATAPYWPYKLLIPTQQVQTFNRNLALVPEKERVNWTHHQVSPGDSLPLIAQRYHTTVHLIRQLNQLKSDELQPGQLVLIPNGRYTPDNTNHHTIPQKTLPHFIASAQYKILHIVQQNESYATLQNKYHVSINDIQIWNQLTPNTPLHVGQQLVIWKKNSTQSVYTVKAGDSLSEIAEKQNTKISTLLQLNPDLKNGIIRPGQQIRLV